MLMTSPSLRPAGQTTPTWWSGMLTLPSPPKRHVCTLFPDSTSQILTVWSALQVTKRFESPDHDTPKMDPLCSPSPICFVGSPVLPSYSCILLSAPTETRVLPSGENATP